MKTAICLTLLCFVIGAYCAQKKASCDDPQSFYDNSCTTLAVTADNYCSQCCPGLAEYADECGIEGAGDALRQGCEALDQKCGEETPEPTTGATTAKGSASFNIIASCTVMLLAKAAYVIM